jgi:cell division septum initiation protein DivIVA
VDAALAVADTQAAASAVVADSTAEVAAEVASTVVAAAMAAADTGNSNRVNEKARLLRQAGLFCVPMRSSRGVITRSLTE